MIVGIYKIPPLWDRIEAKSFIIKDKIEYVDSILTEFNEHSKRITNISNNVYFELFELICDKSKSKEKHYIFIDETLQNNQKSIINNINVWILKSHEDLCFFRKADTLFLRGNYLNYYYNFINNLEYKKIIFYPATSFVYNYSKNNKLIKSGESFKLNGEIIINIQAPLNHLFYERIDDVLIHENEDYLKIFNKSKNKVLFNKPPSKSYYFLNLERIYDFIYIGDATQFTKNHHLMFDFIKYCEKYCENNNIQIKIIYISDKEILKKNIKNYIDPNLLENVKLEFNNYLKPNELNIYMNKSKINLTFSGRDAFPRTITETLYAGCYNIAFDTLSDGKNIIDGIFGEIIKNKNGNLKILKSKSISYENDDFLWQKIININNNKFNHEQISSEAKNTFNYESILKHIYK